jgi:hypothetical protein
MGNGDHQRTARYIFGDGSGGIFTFQENVLTYELLVLVAQQYTWQQASLAEDLKTVTHAYYTATFIGKLDHALHHRAEPGNSAAAQVIAVGKPAGENDTVLCAESAQVFILVPKFNYLLAKIVAQGIDHIVIAVRAGKGDNTEFHVLIFLDQ